MIAPLMGKLAFVARLIPMFPLTGEFLFEQVNCIINLIHDSGGKFFLVMNDNLRSNENMFSLVKGFIQYSTQQLTINIRNSF